MPYRDLPASTLRIDGRDPNVIVYRATSFLARGKGLLFGPRLARSEALWISPCNSVHTFGMDYGIDVVFLDAQMRVIAHRESLQPRRWAACRRAKSVLELPARAADRIGIEAGAAIRLEMP